MDHNPWANIKQGEPMGMTEVPKTETTLEQKQLDTSILSKVGVCLKYFNDKKNNVMNNIFFTLTHMQFA
mgnify:CR=1 FL=1